MMHFTLSPRLRSFITLSGVSVITGFFCAILADSLKRLTEFYEDRFFHAAERFPFLMLVLPLSGLLLIYFLRQSLFRKKENKGIREIFQTMKGHQNELPMYKIPSHYINGLLTVIFGGSTGIEVSTVVASATAGSVIQKRTSQRGLVKNELISAAVAAGITALFNSPLAGILFSAEVLAVTAGKISLRLLMSCMISALTAWSINANWHEEALFPLKDLHWNTYAIPYFMILGVFAGMHGVYLTRMVLLFKRVFAGFRLHSYRLIAGAGILSLCLLAFPQLYGEGYHAVKSLYAHAGDTVSASLLITFIIILILKPVVTSATLASGGDGGVFAPSLFIGAFLGLVVATLLNTCFQAQVIPVNFMVIGMAATLSASIHAPFTAVFLVCGLIGSYVLIVPVLIGCLVSKLTSRMLYPYTVYSYPGK